LKAYVSQ